MERGKVYLDDDGDEITYLWDGSIRVTRNGKLREGGDFVDFNEFKQLQDQFDIHYLDTLEFYEDLDPEEPREPSRVMAHDEAVCLAEECRRGNPTRNRTDQHQSLEHIHSAVTYTFLDWEIGETSSKQTTNQQWLTTKHEKMVCILSVSLAKPNGSSNRIDDTRRTMLMNAIYGWHEHGWSVLLFIPAHNRGQYEHCAKIKQMFDNNAVNIVPYRLEQGTCNVNMNVGESRNAILHFIKAYRDIIKVCTVADERVEALLRPRPVLSNSNYNVQNESRIIKDQRIREGYDRLAAVNAFLHTGAAAKPLFKQLQRSSDAFWARFSERDTKFCRSVVALYDKVQKPTSVFHQLLVEEPTLIGLPTDFRGNMQKALWEDLHKPRRRYKHWGLSGSDKFLGGDVAPFAPERLTMPTQLITFKVGDDGWDGEFFYPFTTIGEDNFFSYQWSIRIGAVRQLNAVQIIRKFPKTAVSITRTPDDVKNYTPCAIKELMFIINSDTYYQKSRNNMPAIKWIENADKGPMNMNCYKWQAFIFCQIPAEADRRFKLGQTDMVVSAKVRRVCDKLLTYILSDQFRKPIYFVEAKKEIYNKMIAVIKRNQKQYVKALKLKFPKKR